MSVQFKHMKVSACPTCGCEVVVREEIEISQRYGPNSNKGKPYIREHTNGQRWEIRTFLCGFSTTWVPNYSRAEASTACPQTPGLAAIRKAQTELHAKEQELHDKQKLLRLEEASILSDIKL